MNIGSKIGIKFGNKRCKTSNKTIWLEDVL